MELAVASAVVGGGLQAAGSVMRGREEARASQFEKQQYEVAEQQTRTQAAQSEAARRDQLTSSLETIQAIRAGRGTGAFSPTGEAILTSAIEDTERDVAIERANYATRADLSRRAALMSDRKSKYSLLSGYLGAAEAVTSGATRAYSVGKYGRP